jgi:hypothetical protein
MAHIAWGAHVVTLASSDHVEWQHTSSSSSFSSSEMLDATCDKRQGKRPFATLWSNSDRRASSTHESPPLAYPNGHPSLLRMFCKANPAGGAIHNRLAIASVRRRCGATAKPNAHARVTRPGCSGRRTGVGWVGHPSVLTSTVGSDLLHRTLRLLFLLSCLLVPARPSGLRINTPYCGQAKRTSMVLSALGRVL